MPHRLFLEIFLLDFSSTHLSYMSYYPLSLDDYCVIIYTYSWSDIVVIFPIHSVFCECCAMNESETTPKNIMYILLSECLLKGHLKVLCKVILSCPQCNICHLQVCTFCVFSNYAASEYRYDLFKAFNLLLALSSSHFPFLFNILLVLLRISFLPFDTNLSAQFIPLNMKSFFHKILLSFHSIFSHISPGSLFILLVFVLLWILTSEYWLSWFHFDFILFYLANTDVCYLMLVYWVLVVCPIC